MIISHKHKFIFLKTSKTAGTSIEIALSMFCGPDDVITPIAPEDEEIRNRLGYRVPQNYHSPSPDDNSGDVSRFLQKSQINFLYYNHAPASEVRARVGWQVWENYFKFCVARNPWDRCVSRYYWEYTSEPRPSFSGFVDSKFPLMLMLRGFGLYTIDGQAAVDKICRFENLEEDLEAVRIRSDIPEKLDLPHAKSRFRKDRRSYREYYGENEINKIAGIFRDEINLLGYEF